MARRDEHTDVDLTGAVRTQRSTLLQRRSTLTDRGRAMLAAGATLMISGMLLGFADLIRVGALALALPLLTLMSGRRRPPELRTSRRTVPDHVVVGQPAVVHLTMTNTGRRTTPSLLGEEHLGYGLGERARLVLEPVPPHEVRTATYDVRPVRRGRHVLGPLTMYRRDPFGLTVMSAAAPGTHDLVALPIIHPLAGTPSASGAGNEGTMPSLSASHGHDDAAIRGYQEGDDLRRIHWPVTAHRGELMVRHESRPSLRRAVLLLDARVAVPNRARTYAGLDHAVETLASIASHLAQLGFIVHVVTPGTVFAGDVDRRCDAAEAVRALAVVEPDDGFGPERSGPSLLSVARELSARGGLLIAAVSDHDEGAVHQLLDLLAPSMTGLLLLYDSRSFAGHPPSARTADLAGLARSGGWHAAAVTRDDTVAAVWRQVCLDPIPVRG